MRAAIFDGPGKPLRIAAVDDPVCGEGEVVLRVRACGICGSDLAMTAPGVRGYAAPCVMGHEFAGEVVAIGGGVSAALGERVVAMPFLTCGQCASCRSGHPNHCLALRVAGTGRLPGAFAEFVRISAHCCLPLPDTLGFEDGALVEPFAVARHGLQAVAGRVRGARVAVIGAGMIGLAATYWAARMGAARIAVAARTERGQPMAEHMGADGFIAGDIAGSGEAIRDALAGAPDIIVECVGKPGLVAAAADIAAPRAGIVMLGYCTSPDSFVPAQAVLRELTMHFCKLYDYADFAAVTDSFSTAGAPTRELVSVRTRLDALPTAFEEARLPTAGPKAMLDPTI